MLSWCCLTKVVVILKCQFTFPCLVDIRTSLKLIIFFCLQTSQPKHGNHAISWILFTPVGNILKRFWLETFKVQISLLNFPKMVVIKVINTFATCFCLKTTIAVLCRPRDQNKLFSIYGNAIFSK